MNSGAPLELKLSLTRKDFSLNVDLMLPGKGVTVLFGPSGSGKTTILRCVAGLEQARGRVVINHQLWLDTDLQQSVPIWSRDLGYVFQEASLFEHMNVQANLRYGISRARKQGGHQALESAISLLGIGHLLERPVQSLSGGERQRVAIARALATQPSILLLDEPLASLDLARREEILPWLETLHRELQIPMLYVTHSMAELTRLADYVVLVEQGRVKAQGAISDVLSDIVFASAVGGEAGTVLTGIVEKHDDTYHLTRISINGAHLWVRHQDLDIGSQVRLHIHANDVSLATIEPHHTSIQNILSGVIDAIHADNHPASCLVSVRHHDHRIMARMTRKAISSLSLEVGSPVWMQVKSVALMNR